MPALATTQKPELQLDPRLKRKLLTELRTYAELHERVKAAKHAEKKALAKITDIQDEIGEGSLKVEGFSVTRVIPTRSEFDPQLFVANGGDLAIYNQSIVKRPASAYTRVTPPGAKEDSDD